MASNGLPLKIDYAIADLPPVDILFVCVGLSIDFPGKSKVLSGLRTLLQEDVLCIMLTGDISKEALSRIELADCVLLSKPVAAAAW